MATEVHVHNSTRPPFNVLRAKMDKSFMINHVLYLTQEVHSLFYSKTSKRLYLLDNCAYNISTRTGSPCIIILRESSGSVVECLTRDRGAAGSSLTGVTALWSLSKTHLS